MNVDELIRLAKQKGVRLNYGKSEYPLSISLPSNHGLTESQIESLHDITAKEWNGDELKPTYREPYYGC